MTPSAAKNKWRIEVCEHGTDTVIHTVECRSEKSAERAEDGMQHNLNHEKYYTRTKKPGEP
jgi:hypothetical protein